VPARSRRGHRYPPPPPFLLAYRELVRQVPALPRETPVIGPMILYLLLPFGSWVASGIVQSDIERLLGR